MSLTAESCRAGRALLGWSMRDLVARSGVSLGVVNRLEGGGCATHTSTAARIVTAFAANGVRLVGDDSYTGAVLMRSGK